MEGRPAQSTSDPPAPFASHHGLDMLPDRLPLVGMALDPNSRRQFLAFLAGSPLLAAAGLDREWLTSLGATARPDALLQAADTVATAGHPVLQPPRITRAADALDVFDFEGVAQQNIPVAHWGYLMTGTDDDGTIAANRAGFDRWTLKPRRLVDVSRIDASMAIFGQRYPTPIIVNPLGSATLRRVGSAEVEVMLRCIPGSSEE